MELADPFPKAPKTPNPEPPYPTNIACSTNPIEAPGFLPNISVI